MSTHLTTYVLAGYRMSYKEYQSLIKDTPLDESCDKFEYDKWQDADDGWRNNSVGEIKFITDGMCGKFAFFGEILGKSDEYAGLPIIECKAHSSEKELQCKLRNLGLTPLPDKGKIVIDKPFSIYAFTQAS